MYDFCDWNIKSTTEEREYNIQYITHHAEWNKKVDLIIRHFTPDCVQVLAS